MLGDQKYLVLAEVGEGWCKESFGRVADQAGSNFQAILVRQAGPCRGPAGIRHKQSSLPHANKSGNKMCQRDKPPP